MTKLLLTKEEQIDLAWLQHTQANNVTGTIAIYTETFVAERFYQQKGLCHYYKRLMVLRQKGHICDDPGSVATREHVISRDKGGKDDPDNIVVACYDCNNLKGNIDPALWYQWIEECPIADDPALLRQYLRLEVKEHRDYVAKLTKFT